MDEIQQDTPATPVTAAPAPPSTLSRDEILALDDILEELVTVPEWRGSQYLVRGLMGDQRDDYEASCIKGRGRKQEVNLRNARAKLVTLTTYTPDGKARVFQDGDAEELGRKSAAALQRLFEPAARLSGLTEDDMEELAKN
jgi:hypothetical protein